MALIELAQVNYLYRTDELETRALNQVSMALQAGDYVAISGPSGCGKSTLLSVLGLLENPSSGSYRLNDRETIGLTANERARVRNLEIGFVFQAFHLLADLNVLDNVSLPLKYRRILSKAECRARAEQALERVGLSHRAKHAPGQLSGGQQQRVAIARAIAGAPKLLLADEPTGNLDSATGEDVMNLLQSLNEGGMTIVLVTHEARFAARAKSELRMHDGELRDAGVGAESASLGT